MMEFSSLINQKGSVNYDSDQKLKPRKRVTIRRINNKRSSAKFESPEAAIQFRGEMDL